jgi:hypothetical protein
MFDPPELLRAPLHEGPLIQGDKTDHQILSKSWLVKFEVWVHDLKEIGGGFGPDPLVHVHLPAAFPDDAHDARVGDGTLHLQRPLIKLLELLVVLQLGVHLDFQGVHFEQLRPLFHVVHPVFPLTRPEVKDDQ